MLSFLQSSVLKSFMEYQIAHVGQSQALESLASKVWFINLLHNILYFTKTLWNYFECNQVLLTVELLLQNAVEGEKLKPLQYNIL